MGCKAPNGNPHVAAESFECDGKSAESAFTNGSSLHKPPLWQHDCFPQLGDTTLIKPRKRFIIPFDKQDYSHRFIQGLQELGIDIVLLHHPRSVQLEAMYEATPEAEGISDLIGKFQQNYDIPYWRCPLQFPYRYYRDQAHMNHIGRKKYNSWLLTKIAQYKKDS